MMTCSHRFSKKRIAAVTGRSCECSHSVIILVFRCTHVNTPAVLSVHHASMFTCCSQRAFKGCWLDGMPRPVTAA